MNYIYILKEIKKAQEFIVTAYESLGDYENKFNNKHLALTKEYISEADEILSNLEIDIEIELGGIIDEQLQ